MTTKGPKYTGAIGPQTHCTPPDLIEAITDRLGPLIFDLASSSGNICDHFFGEADDSLSHDWREEVWAKMVEDALGDVKWLWLNPPFSGGIDPESGKKRTLAHWTRKCWEESQKGCRILCLVPYSPDANWWRDWVIGKARSEALAPRIKFVGSKDPYPKPLALLVYEPGVIGAQGGYWRWKK
jgi:hypothetical protein